MRSDYYRCENGHIFAAEDAETFQDDHGVRDPYPVYETCIRCPECRNEDLSAHTPCSECDDIETPADPALDGMCEAHFRELMGDAEGLEPDGEEMNAWILASREALRKLNQQKRDAA